MSQVPQTSNNSSPVTMDNFKNNDSFADIKQNFLKLMEQTNDNQLVLLNETLLTGITKELEKNAETNKLSVDQVLEQLQQELNKTNKKRQYEKKPMKPSVSRMVNFKEFIQKMNAHRIVTVKYEYNRIDKTLKYGAVIYMPELGDNKKYNKSGHVKTANTRFTNSPIVVNNFTDDKDIKLFHVAIRQQIHKYGVKSKKDSDSVFNMAKLPKLREKKTITTPTVTPKGKPKVNKVKEEKEMKQFLTRFTNFKEVKGNTKRNITIKYEYDRVNKTLKYGATIHKADVNNTEHYDKERHKETAEKRFLKKPVVVTNFENYDDQTLFNQKLRNQLFKYGVKSKKQC